MSTPGPVLYASHAAPPPRRDLRALGPWYAIEFLNSYAATLLTAGAYDYANKVLHVSPSTSLWISAFWGFSYIFICLNAGKMSERFGSRRIIGLMVVGSVISATLGLAALVVPAALVVVAVMLPFNFASSTIWPAIESAITQTRATASLSTRTALYNLSWGSSGFAAFFTCGALEKWWWGNVFLFPALCSLLSLGIFFLWAPANTEIGKHHVPDESATEHDISDPALALRAKRLLLMAWIGNTFAYVAINVLIPVKAALATEAGVTSLTAIGIITSIWGFTRFAGFFLTWKWAGWHYKARWLVGSQFALALTFAAMFYFHDPRMLIASQILFGFAAALIYSSSLYYAMHVSDGHGGHAGIHEALIGLGIATGPAIGALAGAGELGRPALHRIALAVTILLLVGAAVMACLSPRKPKMATDEHG